MRLIIATRNINKFREIKKILKDLKVELVCLMDLRKDIKIKEDGNSFFENAFKKALITSGFYRLDYVLGEDSGLEVPYLKNEPGIFSRRYAGKDATDLDNNLKLLSQLKGVSKKDRRAYFRCVAALVKDGKLIKKFEGKLAGTINEMITGRGGFGYDPVFYLPHRKKTVAQLTLGEKNKISHRAKTFMKLNKFLANYLENK